eukprot:g39748.t1
MGDVAVFCLDPLSVRRLMSICDLFELAWGIKINCGKGKAMFFGNWANWSFIPFTVMTDYHWKYDHKFIRKWSALSILKTLWAKERVNPVMWFPEQIAKVIWQNASSPELSNEYQEVAWLL